jgi:hypothetical protein
MEVIAKENKNSDCNEVCSAIDLIISLRISSFITKLKKVCKMKKFEELKFITVYDDNPSWMLDNTGNGTIDQETSVTQAFWSTTFESTQVAENEPDDFVVNNSEDYFNNLANILKEYYNTAGLILSIKKDGIVKWELESIMETAVLENSTHFCIELSQFFRIPKPHAHIINSDLLQPIPYTNTEERQKSHIMPNIFAYLLVNDFGQDFRNLCLVSKEWNRYVMNSINKDKYILCQYLYACANTNGFVGCSFQSYFLPPLKPEPAIFLYIATAKTCLFDGDREDIILSKPYAQKIKYDAILEKYRERDGDLALTGIKNYLNLVLIACDLIPNFWEQYYVRVDFIKGSNYDHVEPSIIKQLIEDDFCISFISGMGIRGLQRDRIPQETRGIKRKYGC